MAWWGGNDEAERRICRLDVCRESTATFPHILSPCRRRARVQSAPIYRGGKAAAAYLVEYLYTTLDSRPLYLSRCYAVMPAATQRRRARARARSSARS